MLYIYIYIYIYAIYIYAIYIYAIYIYAIYRPPDDSYTDETDCLLWFFEVKRKTILHSIYMVLSTVCVS